MSGPVDSKCNCGRDTRYSHVVDGKQVFSCNKYHMCLPYDDLLTKMQLEQRARLEYMDVLIAITSNDLLDYEIKAAAKAALDIIGEI